MSWKLLAISVISAIRVDREQPPVIVFGGMGSTCDLPVYKNLVQKLNEDLHSHVECYATKVMDPIHK